MLGLLWQLAEADDIAFALDERLCLPEGMKLRGSVWRVKKSILSRLAFEWRLRHLLGCGARVLCMGSLPPLLAHQGEQIVFVQNRYLVEDLSLEGFPLAVRLRIEIERWWLRSRSRYVSRFVVQTNVMRKLLQGSLKGEALVIPFVEGRAEPEERSGREPEEKYDFLYVASGEPHKNHRCLIEAWVKLADRGKFPSLCLTIDRRRFPSLSAWIDGVAGQHGLNVVMVGESPHTEVEGLYRSSRALVFPSRYESLGLPLIEAVERGLPVLASKADYVGELLDGADTFDPGSADSIAQAVAQFPFRQSRLKLELVSPKAFLSFTLCRSRGS